MTYYSILEKKNLHWKKYSLKLDITNDDEIKF